MLLEQHIDWKDGVVLDVIIRPRSKNVRTVEQNRYWWGEIVPKYQVWYLETNGETITKDQAHYNLLVETETPHTVKVHYNDVTEVHLYKRQSSGLTKKQFTELIEKAKYLLSSRGVVFND